MWLSRGVARRVWRAAAAFCTEITFSKTTAVRPYNQIAFCDSTIASAPAVAKAFIACRPHVGERRRTFFNSTFQTFRFCALTAILGAIAYLSVSETRAQQIDFNTMALNGVASVIAGPTLQLTNGNFGGNGSAWTPSAYALTSNTNFSASFDFAAFNALADGITFTVQNDPRGTTALGSGGSGLGYGNEPSPGVWQGNIQHSLAVGLDYYTNFAFFTPPQSLLLINPSGLIANSLSPVILNSGSIVYVWIDYIAKNQTINVYVNSVNTKPATPSLTGSYNVFANVGNQAYFGFTGATGDLTSTTDVYNFTLSVWQAITALSLQGLNINQTNVANTLNNFIAAGGTLPANFQSLSGLSGGNLASALSQLDGEAATGAERGAFQLMNEFLGLMLDPFVYGRGGFGAVGEPFGFAPDQQSELPPEIALAYASVLKAPPPATAYQRWTAWGASYGGSNLANGDAAVGSTNVIADTYGYAGGMDYHYSSDTIFGFALAGAGTNWGLEQGLGSGRSNALQAGVYGVTRFGPAYLGAALAFTNNWFTTDRSALGDQITAGFQGQSYGARLEGGYRFAGAVWQGRIGVTPYAALQAQDFHTPAYNESDLTGGGLGLSYAAMSGTDTRSELGTRFDDPMVLSDKPLVLRARLAWAHDWVSNPALGAAFESLPGTSFIVNGAPVPHDSALASAGAELKLTRNWSLIGDFNGEFASGSQTYTGSGTLRYTW